MPDDEISVLWHGEHALADVLETFPNRWSEERRAQLRMLLVEIQRIRLMRAQRQAARLRAKQAKRKRVLDEASRGDRRVREMLAKQVRRTMQDGDE